MSNRVSLCAMVLIVIICPVLIASNSEYEPGQVIVRFAPKTEGKERTIAQRNAILTAVGVGNVKDVSKFVPGLTLVKLAESMSVKNAIIVLDSTDGILSAQPNYIYKAFSAIFPNDPYGPKPAPVGGDLWGMHNTGQTACEASGTTDADIDAPEAWDIETDASDIIVAVIDSGIDYYHEDLAANMWINPGEDQEPFGVITEDDWNENDDDGNGYEDDICGWDFCKRGQERDSKPMDEHGHGTHVSGTLGAVGNNNKGVVGVCWNVKIMALRFIDTNGHGNAADAIACIQYAIDNGAKGHSGIEAN